MKDTNCPSTWTCDVCGGTIDEAAHGWVEWLDFPDDSAPTMKRGRGARILHADTGESESRRCQYSDYEAETAGAVVGNLPLREFCGPDGLILLLEMLEEDALPKEEVLELIKRIHIPGYEQARSHFEQAIDEGVFEPNSAPGYYSQKEIKAVLRWAARRRR